MKIPMVIVETQLKKYLTFEQLNKSKFKLLLEDAFGKKLIKDYFTYANPNAIMVIEKENQYVGAIVAEAAGNNVQYLDKIAIAKTSQGNGIGKKLWQEFGAQSKKLIWRAKENNPINLFYQKNCDGFQKVGDWIMYWKGLSQEELQQAIAYAAAKKSSFEE